MLGFGDSVVGFVALLLLLLLTIPGFGGKGGGALSGSELSHLMRARKRSVSIQFWVVKVTNSHGQWMFVIFGSLILGGGSLASWHMQWRFFGHTMARRYVSRHEEDEGMKLVSRRAYVETTSTNNKNVVLAARAEQNC